MIAINMIDMLCTHTQKMHFSDNTMNNDPGAHDLEHAQSHFQIRESPDGENSSMLEVLNNKCVSRNSTAFGVGEITEEVVDDHPIIKDEIKDDHDHDQVRDVVRDYVLQEEHKIAKRKSKLPLKFKKELKPACVSKTRSKFANRRKLKTRSSSTDKIYELNKKSKSSPMSGMSAMSRHSMDRLPTLSAFDEERIVWLKNLEDDIAYEEDRRRRTNLRRQQATQDMSTTSTSSSPSSPSTCISRGSSPYNRIKSSKQMSDPGPGGGGEKSATFPEISIRRPDQLDAIGHELSVQTERIEMVSTPTQTRFSSSGTTSFEEAAAESGGKISSKNQDDPDADSSIVILEQEEATTIEVVDVEAEEENKRKSSRRALKKKEREAAEERRKSKSRKKVSHKPLSVECFIVSRGWQLDQTKLLRSLDRLKSANFSRVQLATTINRVVESIRPHQDSVIIHIGNQELMEAAHSVVSVVAETGENVRDSTAIGLSVAGSVATVMSRHIITAANQNRETQFIISMPLPVSLSKTNLEADVHYAELRRMFNATMKANCSNCSNIQICDNENLAGTVAASSLTSSNILAAPTSTPNNEKNEAANDDLANVEVAEGKYILDNHQLTSAGMRKLTRNWENCLGRISRASDGQLIVRRSSESSSGTSGDGHSNPKDAADHKKSDANGNETNPKGGQGQGPGSSSGSSCDSLDQRVPWKPC